MKRKIPSETYAEEKKSRVMNGGVHTLPEGTCTVPTYLPTVPFLPSFQLCSLLTIKMEKKNLRILIF